MPVKLQPRVVRHEPSRFVRKAVGLVLGTAAATFSAGCATQNVDAVIGRTPTSLVNGGPRGMSLTAARTAQPEVVKSETSAVADPGQLGPRAVTKTTWSITCPAFTTKADVYVPSGDALGVVIHCHGLWSNKDEHKGTAVHFASHGMIVVVPDMPFGDWSAAKNAGAVMDIVDWAKAQFPGERIALSGHSFGGLTASIAAEHPDVTALVGLDPAKQGETGLDVEPRVHAQVLYVMGEREMANQGGNGKDLYDAMSSAPKSFLRIAGAHHTDFQNASTTGPKNPANAEAMRLATAFLESAFGNHADDAYIPSGIVTKAALSSGALADH